MLAFANIEKKNQHCTCAVFVRVCTYACRNLDQTTRDVFKENVRLQEALKHHVKESDQLKVMRP